MNTNDNLSLWHHLVRHALELPTPDIPKGVLDAACGRVIDTVGSALAGASSGEGLSAGRIVCAESGAGAASVWVSGGATRPAATACLANGMLAHAIDYDDTHAGATLHPGAVVVPAAIAVAEEVGASGQDVLAAVAIGYEISVRLGLLTPGKFQGQGFHPTAILGIFGATAAAARLMKVPLDVGVNAGGIAGSLSSGLMEYLADGSDVKQLHAGWMAQGAVRAVQFALHGLTGPSTVLEGSRGVFRSFLSQTVDPQIALTGLGDKWLGIDVGTKPYAACHAVHACIDSWLLIRERHGLSRNDIPRIKRLTGLVPEFYVQLVGAPLEQKRVPRTVYEARFSLPYAVARAVVDGEVNLGSFAADRLNDANVLEVAAKVDFQIVEYSTFPGDYPGGLEVEMMDGRVFKAHLDYNVGSTRNPLSQSQLHGKMLEAARRVSDDATAQVLLHSLLSLGAANSDLRGFSAAMARFGPLNLGME
jgi:2-methylcitrate dehydratase PrpD